MRRLAKTLIAGTVLVIQAIPALNPVATSQSTVNNNQVQLGDVFSTQTLNVVDVSDSTTATTSASGNTVSSSVVSGSLNVQSSQTMSGSANASTTVNVTTNAGAQTTLNTSALGNGSDVGSFEGGPVTGAVSQTTGPGITLAGGNFNAYGAQTGAATLNVQAIANSHGVTVSDTSANTTATQTSTGQTEADGAAVLGYTAGTVAGAATGISNNLTGAGSGNASQTLTATQSMTGDYTQATQSLGVGNGQAVQSTATATANNIYVTNENGPAAVTDSQTNTGQVIALSTGSASEFGAAQSGSEAIGNSVLVGNAGPSTDLDNTQTNSGGVTSNASFTGNTGFDASTTATAMGNAVTGFSCSDCGGTVNIQNSQTSGAGVQATSTLDITGANRSVSGSAVAVGNNATFYVSKPSH
ncbi:MAG TPA: holdfast anchor protein HfaD [Caulobacteraceae bacterium]|jgi:hypothetical protein|nr:holdfast anchor protein HfaD [Caulobacteraceae bacterium]